MLNAPAWNFTSLADLDAFDEVMLESLANRRQCSVKPRAGNASKLRRANFTSAEAKALIPIRADGRKIRLTKVAMI